MNNFYKLMLSALFALASNMVQGQLTGTRTIPSANYGTIKIAIDSINTYGVGAGGIIYNITPGHYERTTGNIALLNNTGSSNSITFKKNGAGANPIITGGTGAGNFDGVLRIEGTDSVTIDGLELRDTTANTTNSQMMEYGVVFFRKSATDGSNNCKVINCVVKLQKANTNSGTNIIGSVGIAAQQCNSSGTTQTGTVVGYRVSNLLIENDSISNVATGIAIYNTSTLAYSYIYDDNVIIRNNNISNIGNSSITYYGIRFDQCTGASVYNNTIIGGTGNTTTCYGIYNTGNDSMTNTVRKNFITLTPSNTGSQTTAINFASYSGAQGTLTVDSNTITNCTMASAAGSEWDGIKFTTSLNYTTFVTANNITNNRYGASSTATGAFHPIFVSSGANTNSGSSLTINNNTITGNRRVQSTNGVGVSYLIYLTAEALTTSINNNTIQNDTFPGSGEFAGIYDNYTGASTNRKIYNNIISNNTRLHGIVANSSGATYGILSSSGVGTDSVTNNTIRDYSIMGTGAFEGIRILTSTGGTQYIYADSIYNNTDSGVFNGITHTSGLNVALTIRKCYVNNNTAKSTTGAFVGINATFTATCTTNTCNIDSNTCTNNTSPLATSGGMTQIQVTTPPFNLNIKANQLNNNTLGSSSATATGNFYGINTTTANATALSTVTISNNYYMGNRRIQSSLGAGVNTGILCGAVSVNQTVNNNYIAYNTCPSTGTFQGINVTGTTASSTWNIYNNTVTRMYRSSASTGQIAGIITQSGASTITANVYNNSVDSLSTLGTGQFFGIYNTATLGTLNMYNDSVRNNIIHGNLNYCMYQAGAVTTANIYRNRVGNITNMNAACNNWGIVMASGTTNNVHNNLVGNLHAPISTNTLSLVGIFSNAGTNNNIYYNTVRLNGTSSANGFGSAAFYSNTAPTSTDVRNNIFVNTSTNSGSGQTVAFRRVAVGLTNYRDSSGNNIYYAGTPGTSNLIFTDGSNPKQTISAMQSFFRVVNQTNRDLFSYTENVSFIDTNYNNSNWLKVDSAAASSVESGGQNIYFKTTDDYVTNAIRTGYPLGGQVNGGGVLPDIGAYEGDGTPQTAMTYSTTNVTTATTWNTARSQRNQHLLRMEVVTSGQYNPVSITNFKLNPNGTDSLSDLYVDSTRIFYTGNVANYDSLSRVSQGTMATPFYNLTSSTKLMSGSNYFWLAFDVKPTATSDDTVDAELEEITVAGTQTINAAPAGERIIRGPMCGSYTVGATGFDFASVSNAVNDLNIRGIDTNCTSRVTLNLMDATYSSSETFPIIVQELSGSSYGGRSVIMKPGTGVDATITGANTNSLFILNGTDYFTIDGSNNGTNSRNLTFYNSIDDQVNTQSYDVIRMVSKGVNAGCKLDTIRNSIVYNFTGVWSTAAATIYNNSCISMSGSTLLPGINSTAGYDMDSIAIYGNVLKKSHYGIYMGNSLGTSKSDRVYIGYNEIGSDAGSEVLQDAGMVLQNIDNSIIEHNHVFNLRQYSWVISPIGIDVQTGVTNTNIRKNKLHGFGYNLPNANAFGSTGIRLITATSPANDTIANNIMYDISGCGSTTSAASIKGLLIATGQSNLAVYNNSINLTGTIGHPVAALDTSACIWIDGTPGATLLDIRNNVLVNKLDNSSGTAYGFCILGRTAANFSTTTDNNDYFVSGSENHVGFLSPSLRTSLANWQSAVGTNIDSLSVSANPTFNADTSLTPLPGSPLANAGLPVTGVTDDYSGTARSVSTPTIGAFETVRDVIPPTISYTVINNTSNTGNYTLSNLATVTDAFSNPVKNVRLYYKKTTDANTYVGNTSADNGWKYVDGTGSSPFSFVIDTSIIFGGSFTVGDQVQYFVVAEDSVITPAANVGINSGTFALTPSASLLTSAAFPITGTINSYYVSNPISGTVVVDSAGGIGVYTTLTASDGAFNYINSSLLGGDVTIEIHSHTVEPGTVALNNLSCVGGPLKLYITPNNTTTRVIAGSVANAMIRLNGAQNVIFDGRDPGSLTGRYLTFRNTNTTNSTFAFTNDCKLDTIKYCNVEGANTNNTPSPSGTSGANGTIYIGTGPAAGNDSININNCLIGNISSSAVPVVAIYSEGASALISNDAISVLNNEIYNFRDYGIYGFGATNGPDWNMSGNSFYNNLATPPSTSQFPIRFEPGSIADRTTINNNFVGGSAANCAGTWINSGLNTCNAIRVSLGSTDTSNIQGNVVKNWSFTNTTSGLQFVGINIQSNGIIKVGTSSPNMIGDTASATSILLANSTNHFGMLCISSNYVDIQNNYFTGYTQSNSVASTLNLLDVRNGSILVHDNIVGHPTNTGLISSAGTNTIQGIVLTGNATNSISVYNNTLSGISNTASGGGGFTGIATSGTLFSSNIYNNIIGHSDGTTGNIFAVTGTYTGIVSTATGTTNIYNNTISGINLTNGGAGAFTGINFAGAGTDGAIYGNTIGHSSASNAINMAGTGQLAGIFASNTSLRAADVYSNLVANITRSNTGASTNYGILNSTTSDTIGTDVYSNTVRNISYAGSPTVYGIYSAGGTIGSMSNKVYSNTVKTISFPTPSASATFYGIYTPSAGDLLAYNNTIGDASTTGDISMNEVTAFAGIYNPSAADTVKIYNNSIAGITINNSSSSPTVYGIWNSTAASNFLDSLNTFGNPGVSGSITIAGLGTFSGHEFTGATANGITIRNNTVGGLTRSGTGTYTSYGIHNTDASNTNSAHNINNNTIQNMTFAGLATTYGIHSTTNTNVANNGGPGNRNYNNTIKTISFTHATSASLFYPLYNAGAGDWLVYGNTIGDTTATSDISMKEVGTNGFGAIYNFAGTDTVIVYGNTVGGITINNSSTSPNMYGFAYVSTTTYPSYLVDSANMIGNPNVSGSITINGNGAFYGHSFPTNISPTGTRGINIRNNTIGGITRTSTGSANTYGIFDSWAPTGLSSCHNINDNTISNWNISNVGITTALFCNLSSSRNNFVYNNTVKGFTFTNTGTGGSFAGIAITAGKVLLTQPDSASAGNNVIGDPNVSNSINSSMNGPHNGISTSSANAIQIIGNSVNNITATSTGTSCAVGGIACGNGATATTINSNTVKNLSGAGTTTNGFNLGGAVCGIYTTSTSTMTVNNNIINGISLTSTSTTSNAYGIDLYLSGNTTVNSNRIFNMSSTNNGNLTGLYFNSTNASTHVIKNNQISIANGANTNDLPVQGIYSDNAAGSGTVQLYYNTVYLGGSISSGSNISTAYFRNATTGTTNVLNNIFMNSRTGGSGNHLAQAYTGGITNNRTNYNLNITADSNVAVSVSGTNWNINAWRNGLKRDSSGWYAIAGTNVNPDSMFLDRVNGDLGINTTKTDAWYANGKGVQTPGYADEYGNTASVRSTALASGAPDLGSDEFTPTSAPDELFVKGPHTNGSTDSLMYAFRPVAYIKWRGATIPTFTTLRYYTGETPPDSTNNGSNPTARYLNCYWWISATGGGSTEYNINFIYDDALVGTLTSESALRISRKEVGVAGTWKAHIADATVNATTNNMQMLNTHGFSIWTGSDNASPLPVTLVTFNGEKQNKNVMLKWVTSFEEQMDVFEVEYSIDAQNFSCIGFTKAANNHFSENNYNLLHTSPVKGNNYYRLKTMESNGKYSFSNIVVVNFDDVDRMQVLIQPNPSKDQVSVVLQNQTQPALIQVFDMTGRLMFNEKVTLGQNITQVNLIGWNLGSYILRVTNDDGTSFINRIMKVEE